VSQPEVQLATIVSTPFEENSYVVHRTGHNGCLVIDPGLEPGRILTYLATHDLRPAAILNTHGHSDHIAGNALKERWPDCPLVIGAGDAAKLLDPALNLSRAFGIDLVSPAADATVEDGESYSAAGFHLEARAIPGHSAGHVVYVWTGQNPYVVFVGDVIFAGSIGRTDFPDGDFQQLRSGIHAKLFTLPEDTVLLPGHGEPTTVGEEKRSNPFVKL
jgi:hydroxyacylglutathione hydrolase